MSEGLRERTIAAVAATYDLYDDLLQEKERSINQLEKRVYDLEIEMGRLRQDVKDHASWIHQILQELPKAGTV